LWEISVVTFPMLEAASVTAIGGKDNGLAAQIREMTALLKT
jgi:phage head maturation protease